MNTEVGRNLLWNETKVCSLWKKKKKKKKEEEVRQPPGLGLLSVGISIQWPIMHRVYAMIRLGDVSHCVRNVQGLFFLFSFQPCSCYRPGQTWITVTTCSGSDCFSAACRTRQWDQDPNVMTLLFNYTALNGDQGFNTYTVHNVRNVSLLSVQMRRR